MNERMNKKNNAKWTVTHSRGRTNSAPWKMMTIVNGLLHYITLENY